MTEFTFISLTYNHQEYILEHLESIKTIVIKYGDEISIDFILIDDCSSDNTVIIVDEWLKNNEKIFRKISIIKRQENMGVVANIIESVQMTKTKYFKFLAGDDKYTDNNIFEVFDILKEKSLVMTPIQVFGNINAKIEECAKKDFKLVEYTNKKGKLKELIEFNNGIAAPGVFISKELITDSAFLNFIKEFRNIEDYPMWYFYIVKNNCKVIIHNKSYIAYRVGSGISKNIKHPKRNSYYEELERVHKLIDVKCKKYPKFINPYYYKIRLWRMFANL